MDYVKIPFSQYLRGYNNTEYREYKTESDNLAFVSPYFLNHAVRYSDRLIEINGRQEKHPVFEIQSHDFDRWGVINSRYVYNGRHASYSST